MFMGRKLGALHTKRALRLAKEVSPLVAQGQSIYEIADKLGIAPSTASHDVAAVKQIWVEKMKTDINEVRSTAVEQYEWLASVGIQEIKDCLSQGRPTDKAVAQVLNVWKERNKLMGLGLDVNLVQNNLNVHGEASAAEVSQVFSPMDPKDYDAFISQRGAMTVLPPVPDEDGPDNPDQATQRGSGDNDWGVSPN